MNRIKKCSTDGLKNIILVQLLITRLGYVHVLPSVFPTKHYPIKTATKIFLYQGEMLYDSVPLITVSDIGRDRLYVLLYRIIGASLTYTGLPYVVLLALTLRVLWRVRGRHDHFTDLVRLWFLLEQILQRHNSGSEDRLFESFWGPRYVCRARIFKAVLCLWPGSLESWQHLCMSRHKLLNLPLRKLHYPLEYTVSGATWACHKCIDPLQYNSFVCLSTALERQPLKKEHCKKKVIGTIHQDSNLFITSWNKLYYEIR